MANPVFGPFNKGQIFQTNDPLEPKTNLNASIPTAENSVTEAKPTTGLTNNANPDVLVTSNADPGIEQFRTGKFTSSPSLVGFQYQTTISPASSSSSNGTSLIAVTNNANISAQQLNASIPQIPAPPQSDSKYFKLLATIIFQLEQTLYQNQTQDITSSTNFLLGVSSQLKTALADYEVLKLREAQAQKAIASNNTLATQQNNQGTNTPLSVQISNFNSIDVANLQTANQNLNAALVVLKSKNPPTNADIATYNNAVVAYNTALSTYNTDANNLNTLIQAYLASASNYNNAVTANNAILTQINQQRAVGNPPAGPLPLGTLLNLTTIATQQKPSSNLQPVQTLPNGTSQQTISQIQGSAQVLPLNNVIPLLPISIIPTLTTEFFNDPFNPLGAFFSYTLGLQLRTINNLSDDSRLYLPNKPGQKISDSETVISAQKNSSSFPQLDESLSSPNNSSQVALTFGVPNSNPKTAQILGSLVLKGVITDQLQEESPTLNVKVQYITLAALLSTTTQATNSSLSPYADELKKLRGNNPLLLSAVATGAANSILLNENQSSTVQPAVSSLINNDGVLSKLAIADKTDLINTLSVVIQFLQKLLIAAQLGSSIDSTLLPQILSTLATVGFPGLENQGIAPANFNNLSLSAGQNPQALQNLLTQTLTANGISPSDAEALAGNLLSQITTDSFGSSYGAFTANLNSYLASNLGQNPSINALNLSTELSTQLLSFQIALEVEAAIKEKYGAKNGVRASQNLSDEINQSLLGVSLSKAAIQRNVQTQESLLSSILRDIHKLIANQQDSTRSEAVQQQLAATLWPSENLNKFLESLREPTQLYLRLFTPFYGSPNIDTGEPSNIQRTIAGPV